MHYPIVWNRNRRSKLSLLAAVACAILFATAIAFAHTPGAIAGRVLDRCGNPLPGVLVTAVTAVSGVEKHATTDTSGGYVIEPLPPARYTLRAEAKSYGCIIVPEVIVEDGQRAQQDFRFTGEAAPAGCESGSAKKSGRAH